MSVEEKIDALLVGIGELTHRVDEGRLNPRKADGGREAAAQDGRAELAAEASKAHEAREDREWFSDAKKARAEMAEIAAEAIKAVLKNTRTGSLAEAIGTGKVSATQTRLIAGAGSTASPALKAAFSDYQAGELFSAMADFGAAKQFMDMELSNDAKGRLADLGVLYAGAPNVPGGYHASRESSGTAETGWGKATTGVTGATGGYVLPNNLVDTVIKPATAKAVYQKLVTVRNGVNVRGVDQPFRTGAPARMVFQDWNTSKENVNEAYGSYTAYLGTIARIMDITRQYARFSAGSAEADVMDELTRAAILGENFYIAVGAGTGTIGVGDPTTGIYTALAAGPAANRTAFAGASNSTIAGSFASAMAGMNGTLAGRSRENQAVVTDVTTYWTLFSQGSDTAGFWMSDFLGSGFSVGANNVLGWRGTPIYFDPNLGANATTKIAIGGEWDVLKLYRGQEFRIDSSDVAGTRWDYNLIGFRGEEEIGFNAYSAVAVGAMQLVTAVIA